MRDKDILIRNARPEELDEVAALLEKSFRQYEGDIPSEGWRNYLADIVDVRSRLNVAELIVAEMDGELAGSVTLYPRAPEYAENSFPADWAVIRLLAVLPACRGRGIGRRLVEECLRRCRARGTGTIGLHTTGAMDAAVRLYERMGFKRAEEYDFHPRPEVAVIAYRLDV